MSARLILHIVLTLVLFSLGWWLYKSIGNSGSLGSVGVATYWFAMLVYILFSWLFYWMVHRLKVRYWLIMQILAFLISAISTSALLYVSKEHQKQIEDKAMQEQKDEEALISIPEKDDVSTLGSEESQE